MRCPACNHENNRLATRCAACGAMLPTSLNPEPAPSSQDTVPQARAAQEGTAERPQVAFDAPAPTVDNPNFRDVAGAAGKYASSKRAQVGTFFQSHQKALGLGLALAVIAVMGGVWVVLNLLNAPSYTQIQADLSDRLASYEYAGGTYGFDLEVPLSSVTVTKRSATQTPEGMEVAQGVGPAAFLVEAEATFDDGKMRVVRNVAATYVREGDAWKIAGELAEQGTSVTARTGVDEDKVLANVATLLKAADTSDGSLSRIYADGSFSVVGNVFTEAPSHDTATDDVTLHCKVSEAFYSYEGDVVAHFAFESGAWTLRKAEASKDAVTRTYEPLVGTWSGDVVATQSNGADCYGAQDHKLVISLESVGDPSNGRGKVSGAISFMAHYHERLAQEQLEDEGDVYVERLDFTGTVNASRDERKGTNLTIYGSTAGSPDGEVEIEIAFGTDDDPSAVYAYVTCRHHYEESVLLFIPHQTVAEFTDTYVLTRA